jgi:hypothetical protein
MLFLINKKKIGSKKKTGTDEKGQEFISKIYWRENALFSGRYLGSKALDPDFKDIFNLFQCF